MALAAAPLLVARDDSLATQVSGRHRARNLGIKIGRMQPGSLNAITDVAGVEVGYSTIIKGDGKLEIGKGPVRTGVTAIWPHRNILHEFLPCGFDAPNGNGEVTGILAGDQLGVLSSPICLTNTSSVGMVYDVLRKMQPADDFPPGTPVVGETWDGYLNDITGRHVLDRHVTEALQNAQSGPIAEGSVGGGTGMVCYDYKGGTGTASRIVNTDWGSFTVGGLVQSNHGWRELLRIDGVPVGAELAKRDSDPQLEEQNSIVMVIATDAPFLPHQLERLARRATHGLARSGSISGNSSGDFTIAFSTANKIARPTFYEGSGYGLDSIDQFNIYYFLEAVSDVIEEAIINSMFMANSMTGIDEFFMPAIPLNETLEIMRSYGRPGVKKDG